MKTTNGAMGVVAAVRDLLGRLLRPADLRPAVGAASRES